MPDYDLRLWRKPEENKIYAIGGDPAEGLAHGDDTVLEVFCVDDGEQVFEAQGKIDPMAGAEIAFMLGTWYNNALVCIENNKDGGMNRILFELGYRNIYYQMRDDGKAISGMTQKLGFNTNIRTRAQLITLSKNYVQDGSVTIRSEFLLAQMEVFGLEGGKFQAIAGAHDDIVMSFLLCMESFRMQLLHEIGRTNHLNPLWEGQEVSEGYEDLDVIDRQGMTDRLIEQSKHRNKQPADQQVVSSVGALI
jgi:hypothetical protein